MMEILNPHNYELPFNLKEYFLRINSLFIEYFSLPNYEIELVVMDEEKIRKLNFEYRGKDCSTDVLSFPLNPIEGELILGSIYFCYPVIKKNNENLLYEFCFLLIHSYLHLLNYEHGKEMFDLQDKFINQIFNDCP